MILAVFGNNDQLSVGLIAQLVEHWTKISVVRARIAIQTWIFFGRAHYCLSITKNCEDNSHSVTETVLAVTTEVPAEEVANYNTRNGYRLN